MSLLTDIKNGNHEAVPLLLKELEPQISRFISYRVSNEHDVKDLTQETLIRIYRNINSYDESAKLTTWAIQIAKNICVDYYRRKGRHNNFIDLIGDEEIHIASDEQIESSIEHQEFSDYLTEALESLSSSHREAFILRHLEDKTYDEISIQLQLPLNTIKSHIHRARRSLRGLLNEYKLAG